MRFRAMRNSIDLLLWRLRYTLWSIFYDIRDEIFWRNLRRRWRK